MTTRTPPLWLALLAALALSAGCDSKPGEQHRRTMTDDNPTAPSQRADYDDPLDPERSLYLGKDGQVRVRLLKTRQYTKGEPGEERELQLGSALSAKVHAADADEKEDVSDFALWKAHKADDGDNAWDSPWGRGRPGWHIECSAMSKKHLGDTIDLHTGGVDLLFPHHENEIAQSQCCNQRPFTLHWYHSEHLLVDGKKMSKSLGNLYTLDDLTAKGFSPVAVRYALLSGHPRKQLNFTLESVHAAEKALGHLRAYAASLPSTGGDPATLAPVIAALEDDLNTPAALGALFTVVNRGTQGVDAAGFAEVMGLFGFDLRTTPTAVVEAPEAVRALADQRWAAKAARDFARADALRAEIAQVGWTMLDRKDGFSLEPSKR
jgi:cysteinyl-tRNA synthetase